MKKNSKQFSVCTNLKKNGLCEDECYNLLMSIYSQLSLTIYSLWNKIVQISLLSAKKKVKYLFNEIPSEEQRKKKTKFKTIIIPSVTFRIKYTPDIYISLKREVTLKFVKMCQVYSYDAFI